MSVTCCQYRVSRNLIINRRKALGVFSRTLQSAGPVFRKISVSLAVICICLVPSVTVNVSVAVNYDVSRSTLGSRA